jgi:para-nitrobenzyl esterase
MIACLMSMPQAHGLFHRAIMESASLPRLATPARATTAARAVLDSLHVATLSELRSVPVAQLIDSMRATRFQSMPMIDGAALTGAPFTSTTLQSAKLPVLIGSNATEATFFVGTALAVVPLDSIDQAQLLQLVQKTCSLEAASANELIAAFRQQYPDASEVLLYQLICSQWFWTDEALRICEQQVAAGAPVYSYYFDQTTTAGDGKLHTPHALEIPYVFDTLDKLPDIAPVTSAMRQTAAQVSALWAAFARSGDPNLGRQIARSMSAPPRWEPYKLDSRRVMRLGPTIELLRDPAPIARQAMTRLKRGAAGTGR